MRFKFTKNLIPIDLLGTELIRVLEKYITEWGALMAQENFIFTSESVSEGHPDKVCDRISDTVVDLYLKADKNSRIACETLSTTNKIILAGEIRGPSDITHDIITKAVREAVREIGYEPVSYTHLTLPTKA